MKSQLSPLLLSLSTAVLISTGLHGAAAQPPVPIRAVPVPDWVALQSASPSEVEASDGLQELLRDEQLRVTAKGLHRFRHAARRAVSPAGLSEASDIRIEFDPSYERFTWHKISIRRDGKVIDGLATADIRHSDSDAEADDVLLGNTRISAFVRDVRVGDIVEFAYSIEGAQPALAGRFAYSFQISRPYAVAKVHYRLLWPKRRPIQIRSYGTELAPDVTRGHDEDVYVWRIDSPPAHQAEPHTPSGFDAAPWVQLSEFESWAEVVTWALPMYSGRPTAAPELVALAETFGREASYAVAAERAVRFVQDDVRYLGFEFGEGSLRPRPPELVVARRFGDCKDKSMLLVSLLRLLHIDAVPVLVSTSDRDAVLRRLPSPYDFDHVIVRARIDGRPVWIDSTASYERGPLAHRPAPPFAVALPIELGVTAPEPIVKMPQEATDIDVLETFEVPSTRAPAQLKVITRYRGAQAAQQRYRLATKPRKSIEDDYLKFYSNVYGKVRAAGPLQTRDDEAGNFVEVHEAYTIDDLWEDGLKFHTWSLNEYLVTGLPATPRKAPLDLGPLIHVRHTITASLPADVDFPDIDLNDGVTGPGFESSRVVTARRRHFKLRTDYRTTETQIAATMVPVYRKAVDDVGEVQGFVIEPRRSEDALPYIGGVIGILFLFGGGLVVRAYLPDWWRLQRRRSRFKRASTAEPGETPSAAIAVSSIAAIAGHMTELRCTCETRPALRITREPAKSRYGSTELWHQSAECSACGAKATRYFVLETRAPASESTTSAE